MNDKIKELILAYNVMALEISELPAREIEYIHGVLLKILADDSISSEVVLDSYNASKRNRA